MSNDAEKEVLLLAGREVAISNPRKVLFPQAGYTKLDLTRYYVAVAEGALRGAGGRPNVLVRYPNGVDGEFFYQKRAPHARPAWVEVVALRFPSGRTAEEVVPRDLAGLAWMTNLGCLELHPHPVRAEDLDHPDELRVDLDPVPGVTWTQVRDVARVSAPLTWDEIDVCDPRDFTLATMPARFAEVGDRHAAIDEHPASLASLLEMSARHERDGLGDAPWPPHYRKQRDEPPRVQPSRRRSTQPLITVAKAQHKDDALAGLERWKGRHPDAAKRLEVDDVLVDAMRGRSSTWTRIRINLRHVPEDQRPAEETPDPDYDPWRKMRSSS